MSNENDRPVEPTSVSDWHLCPACGGPTSIIGRGDPDEVRYRRRCIDPWCGRSLPVPESESESASGTGAAQRFRLLA